MVDNVVIMAGGAGKRLWPASMGKRPKQFMTVDGGVSLFRGTLDRAFGLGIEGKVYVVTHQDHVEAAVAEAVEQTKTEAADKFALAMAKAEQEKTETVEREVKKQVKQYVVHEKTQKESTKLMSFRGFTISCFRGKYNIAKMIA